MLTFLSIGVLSALGSVTLLIDPTDMDNVFPWIIVSGIVMVFITMPISFHSLIRQVPKNSGLFMHPYRANSTLVQDFPEEVYYLVWDRAWRSIVKAQKKGAKIVSYAFEDHFFTSRLNPITPNPKVRHLTFNVHARMGGSTDRLLRLWHFLPRPNSLGWQDALESELYEFSEANSQELATFYNPLDKVQQDRFYALVARALGPFLAKSGLMLDGASFSV